MEPTGTTDLERLRLDMRAFADERDWGRFHDPKSVLLALLYSVVDTIDSTQLPARA